MAARSICTCFLLVFLHFARAQDQEPSVKNADNPPSSTTPYNNFGQYLVYPENASPRRYFNNKLDFETIDGNILIGAADKLYLLNKDLSVADELSWSSENTNCDDTITNPEYICRNHIRLYEEVPGGTGGARSLLVCGTRSNSPDCRTVEITSTSRFGNLGDVSSDIEGLISAHPDLPGFGEFRRSTPEDSVYFAASFTSSNTRQFDLAYLDVSVDQGPSAQKLYGYLRTSSLWLNFPVVFVDYRRKSYPRPEGSTNEAAYHFYFVFLRENFQVDNREVLYSRVVRICRNDPGIASTQGSGSQIFSTFLKARIFCFREMPPGTEFVGAQDYEFNEIWSLSFNSDQGGRYYADGSYNRLMYGAFSGPLIGPPGTAICVYPAYPAAGQDSLNNGIFDIFQGDVAITHVNASNPQTERQNMFVECAPQGRNTSGEAEDIQIIKDIKQLGDNPLLILDGLHVTQMAVDEVCVVKRSDPTVCLNQDVLFLGTDTGVVYKVVLATVTEGTSSGAIEPVIVDEIQLEDSDDVIEMKIESVAGDKFLYVSTAARIYRLPLENCQRHGTDFNACIGSRDPYCVWDSVEVTCRRSSLTAAGGAEGTVPSSVRQNIHTGEDTVPEVTLADGQILINEGQSPLSVAVTTNSRVSDGVLELVAMDGTARAGVDYTPPPSESVNFPADQNQAVIDISIIQRSEFTGNLRFTIGLKSSGSGALNFGISTATVTIVDEQGLLLQLALGGLDSQTCQQWIVFDPQEKLNAVSNAILNSFLPSAKLEDYGDTFTSANFSCTNGLSTDRQEFTVYRATIDTTKLPATRDNLISSLENWIKSTPNVNDRGNVYTVLTDSNCETIILSLDNPLCPYNGVMVGNAGAVGGSAGGDNGTVNALAVLFAVAMVVIVALVVVLVFVVVFRKREKCYQPNEVTDSGVGLKKVVCTNQNDLRDGSDEGSIEPPPQTPTTATELLKPFDFSRASNGHKDTQTANMHSDPM